MTAELEIVRSRPRGRPSLYNPAYCERVLELAAEGCGKAEIAAALAVSVKTLAAWMKSHDEFREAMTRAKELEYAWWLAAGRKGPIHADMERDRLGAADAQPLSANASVTAFPCGAKTSQRTA